MACIVTAFLVGLETSVVMALQDDALLPTAGAQSQSESKSIKFSFKDATFRQVIDFFSRATGWPVIWESDPPQGTLDYISPESYPIDEALRVLNIILQSRGVMLRVDSNMLYLQKLEGMSRENIPTFVGSVPETITGDQIITVVRPLETAVAKNMAERLATMVAAYGSVTALEQQNSLVIVETAAQVRRLLFMLDELDRQDPEGNIEIIKIKHGEARVLMEPLKALLAIKVEKYVVNQEGKQIKIEEESMPGLNITVDTRTNSIVAKGTSARLDKLREAIEILDVAGSGTSRGTRSFHLRTLTAAEAQAALGQLFQGVTKAQKPAVFPRSAENSVTVVGDDPELDDAARLIAALDGAAAMNESATTVAVVPLKHSRPSAAIAAVSGLQSRRQSAMLKLIAGPDDRSVVISGQATEVEHVRAMLGALDAPMRTDRQLRVFELGAGDFESLVARAKTLYAKQSEAAEPAMELEFEADVDHRVLTVIGAPAALDRFATTLHMVEQVSGIRRETQQFVLTNAKAGRVRDMLQTLSQQMAGWHDDRPAMPEPEIVAIDELDMLLVTASPTQFDLIGSLVRSLDVSEQQPMPPLRILQLRTADAFNLANTLRQQYGSRSAADRREKPVHVAADGATNSLFVSADASLMAEIEAIVDELNKTTAQSREGREIRIFPLKVARAEELARTIDEMFPLPAMPYDSRGRPLPHLQQPREIVVRGDAQTNSLIVDAPVHRMAGFEALVEQLDRQKIVEETEVRTYRVVHADLGALANTLRQLASAGSLSPAGEDRRAAVTIGVEERSRSLIVSGRAEVFPRVEQLLSELDAPPSGPVTVLRMYPLKHARAEALAEMLRALLAARIDQDAPEASSRKHELLNITADRKTNTLILSAPQAIVPMAEELIKQLDSPVAASDTATIRIRPLTFADSGQVAQSLAAALPSMMSKVTGEPMSVKLIASPGSNALILAGQKEDIEEVETLIQPLDARPAMDAIDARTFKLEFAVASRVAPLVQNLLADQQENDPRIVMERIRQSRGQLALTPRIRVEADERTNSLIVSGPAQTVSLAQTMIRQLDQADESTEKVFETFTPANAEANRLAQTVLSVVASTRPSGRRATLEVIAEPQSGAVVVIGNKEEVAQAMSLLKQWDAEALISPPMDLAIIPLRHSDAQLFAQVLPGILRDRSRWPEALRQVARAGLPVGEAAVFADAARNRIIISAPTLLMPLASELVKSADQPLGGAAGSMEMRVFTLKQAEANAVAQAVRGALDAEASQQPGVPRAQVTAESSSNSILITGTPEQLARVDSIIRPLDSATGIDQVQVRTVFLKHARAEAVAPLIEQLLGGEKISLNLRLEAARRRMNLPNTGPEVRVSADRRLNAVVISAPSLILEVAEQMVSQLDVDASAAGVVKERHVRVLAIENADATKLADSIQAIFAAEDVAESPPTIRVDASSNALLVRATEEQFNSIESVVRQVDRATIESSRQMHVVPVDPARASAAELARALQRMLGGRGEGGGVEVITIDELLERRKHRESGEGVRGGSLPGGASSMVVPRLFAEVLIACVFALPQTGGSDAGSANAADVTIAVDPATNSLVIVGSQRAVERIRKLAQQMQDQIPAAPGRVRYILLPPQSSAQDIVRLVNQVLAQLSPLSGTAATGGARSEWRHRVAVLGDEDANAVIVVANDNDFETIGDLIATFSQQGPADALLVKLYPLQTITAERAAASVRDLLGDASPRGRQAQRVRGMAVRVLGSERDAAAVFDPARVRVSTDVRANALMVVGPSEAIRFIDQFVELLDQTPLGAKGTLKLYTLEHARASELTQTLRGVFQARHRNMRDQTGAIQPEFGSDERTNTLLVTASPEHLAEVDGLLQHLDVKLGDDRHPLRIIELKAATAVQAAQLLQRVVVGEDQRRKQSTTIVPDENSGVLLVRASEEVLAEMQAVISEIDRQVATEFPVRTILLQRANAQSTAQTLQRFFDDRARIASTGRGRREQSRRVSVIGDSATRTLLVAASDEDFADIQKLVEQFDTPAATDAWVYRVFPLQHAKAGDIAELVESLMSDLTWNQTPVVWWDPWSSRGSGSSSQRGTLAIRADTRLNALIVTGEGDKFELVETLIEALDAPQSAEASRVVRVYQVKHAELGTISDLIEELFGDPGASRRWWEPANPNQVRIRQNALTKTLFVSATKAEHEEIAALISEIDEQVATPDQQTQVMPVKFARATELSQTLNSFLRDRAQVLNAARSAATILASESANSLIVSAGAEEMATISDLLARLDQPDVTGDRVVEIIALKDGNAQEISRILREQFGRRTAAGGSGVVVTPDVRTNSLIINAPQQEFAQARALVERLDAPSAADETIIRTYALKGAQADEAVRILGQTLQLDARGEAKGISIRLDEDSPAVQVKARVVADRRSNSLIVTGTAASFPIIERLISQLDEVPAASPVEYHILPLKHAMADDVMFTLRQMLRAVPVERGLPEPRLDYNRRENQLIVAATADQYQQIQKIVSEIDQPSEMQRVTDFVALQFAEAEPVREALTVFYGPLAPEADTPGKRNVRIVADPATNSLVISAEEAEWAGIRNLLSKLDNEEYDSSLQLRVIPLQYADAPSVARAINDAFQRQVQQGREQQARPQPRAGGAGEERPDTVQAPSVLVASKEWVSASAEPITNSVIVSANRQNVRKIEHIVEQLDVADFSKLPAPRLIPVKAGDPRQFAASLQSMFEQTTGNQGSRAPRSLRIVADVASSSLIVRAAEEDFAHIRALADALQQQAADTGLSVHVLKLQSAPAARVKSAIEQAFRAKAQQANLPLAIEVDAAGNSLVVASTRGLFEEIEVTVKQMDSLSPAAGQAIFIIELEHISPDAAMGIIQSIGLDKPQAADSVSRLVTEPIKLTKVTGRNALMVVANPVDRETLVGLLKAIDAAPEMAEAQTRIIALRYAEAGAVAQILAQMFAPANQQADTPVAQALKEQMRRLSVRRDGLDEPDLRVDLTKPIRLVANQTGNSIIVSSTPANVGALQEIIKTLDALPITDAVTIRILPLENIAADQFARIIREMFQQGNALGRIPGTNRAALPAGVSGRALLDAIAITVDERTNTVVVAGKEEAVALVEVIQQRLDSQVTAGWVEPRLLTLRFADATDLAETLQKVLVEGAGALPQSSPLQKQVARLRMARLRENGGQVLESDVFTPMSKLIIHAEPQLNALLLIGTPANIEVLSELVTMLDVEAASPSAVVRIYPIENASAARLAQTITQLFDQQVQSKAIRPEDRVIVEPDIRTNSLVVTTSPRSFAVLEGLLRALDSEIAPDLREIRRIELQNASASRLSGLIQQLMDARLERLRKVQPETADLERATIVADPRTNSLVVAAGNESFDVIRRLAEELDRSDLGDTSLVSVIQMRSANADRIAGAIRSIMERRYADLPADLRTSQRPLVLTDPRSNSLLVAANPEDLAAITDLVAKLEATPINPAVGIHVLAVPTATGVASLAERLQRLMNEREQTLGPARTPSDKVAIETDLATNSLIVAATEENLSVVRDLIKVLASAELDMTGGRSFEIIPLRASRASDVVDLLNDLYIKEANRTRGENVVRATADDRLNAVLLTASEADMRAMKSLVAQLDGAKPASVVEIKFVPLTSANALETVNLIENILSGRGISARRGQPQATVIRYLREFARQQGEALEGEVQESTGDLAEVQVSAAIRESITLTPDIRTNTVIVSAPRESIAMIEQMIRDLDSSSVGSKNIRIFNLTNADATAMAQILADLFNLRQGNTFNVLKPREVSEGGFASAEPSSGGIGADSSSGPTYSGFAGIELTTVPDERQQLSITVDSRTNSLLVSGTPRYLDLVEQVVRDLDSLKANEREVHVYPLRNAVAEDVARVIAEFVEREQRKLIETLSEDQLGSAARLLEREVTIQGDALSNTVLISASPRYMETVKKMIAQLDVDPPQVLIQVMLAEVTLDSRDQWGVNFRAVGDNVRAGYGLASAFVTGVGVPNLAVTSGDFDLLIRALQEQGRLQVLSNPSIMAANNAPATLQVGETIQLPTGTSITPAGQTQTQLQADDIGVILEVTPSINPDGFVRMKITPEISSLTERTIQISSDFESPIIDRRKANTTVTVQDGQTIVLGGLISDRYERREGKVPFFGDIPGLGYLFRGETRDTRRTELLIVLTPYVIDSPSAFDTVEELTNVSIDRLSIPHELKQKIRENIRDGTGGLYDSTGRRIDIQFDDEIEMDSAKPTRGKPNEN